MIDIDTQTRCVLPGGYLDGEGVRHREAELVPLSGREEELLTRFAPEAAPAARVTHLLVQCVRRIGAISPVTLPVARQLLVADRQYLLLKLRELSFGDRIEGTLVCPWPQCGARIDIDFSTRDVPVKRCEALRPSYRIDLSPEAAPDGGDALAFRLPNGEDQETLGPLLAENPAQALTRLFERCLVAEPDAPEDDLRGRVAGLSARARLELEQAMAAHAPRVDLEMDLTCPECGRAFTAPFDLQDFFFGELRTSRDLLYRQVHYLAYHYHWSEREILEMPREKRLAYIEILADEIEALNDAL